MSWSFFWFVFVVGGQGKREREERREKKGDELRFSSSFFPFEAKLSETASASGARRAKKSSFSSFEAKLSESASASEAKARKLTLLLPLLRASKKNTSSYLGNPRKTHASAAPSWCLQSQEHRRPVSPPSRNHTPCNTSAWGSLGLLPCRSWRWRSRA